MVPEVNKRSGTTTIMFETDCSCPVGYECKHAVAACLKALEVYGQAKNSETNKIVTVPGPFNVAPSGTLSAAFTALSPSQRAMAESLLDERDETASALDAADLEDLGFLFEEAA